MADNNNGSSGKGFGIAFVIFLVVCALSFCGSNGSSSSDSSDSHRCSVCGRTYTNREDVHSISWNGMCVNCYDNYKYTQKMEDEALKYKERYGD